MDEIAETGGYAEKKEYEKEPWGRAQPLVKLPAHHDPDEDRHNKGDTHTGAFTEGPNKIFRVVIHRACFKPADGFCLKIC
jgi:hypothetical protein